MFTNYRALKKKLEETQCAIKEIEIDKETLSSSISQWQSSAEEASSSAYQWKEVAERTEKELEDIKEKLEVALANENRTKLALAGAQSALAAHVKNAETQEQERKIMDEQKATLASEKPVWNYKTVRSLIMTNSFSQGISRQSKQRNEESCPRCSKA